ncbi:MAG: hypothetical protein IT424_05745 [Pirellulales bacterium]|nr:hypothetical protein [Pirellulales bacterium]
MRRFSGRMVIAALAIGAGYAGARAVAPLLSGMNACAGDRSGMVASTTRSGTTPAMAGGVQLASAAGGDGDRLVAIVLEALENRPNVAASVRQSVRLESQRLSAEGSYWQRSVGNGRRTRWDLTTKVEDHTVYVTQVFDGDVLWTDRRYADARKISRVDVGRIKRELALNVASGGGAGGRSPGTIELLARGGLAQLVAELRRCFTFAPPRTMRRGDRIVLAVIGAWQPEPLGRLWPTAASGGWPAHLPHHVLLHIDSDDYFPYFIEYRGGDQAELASSMAAHFPARDPLSCIEFIDVRFDAAMDDRLFEFSPGDAGFQDGTGRLIEQLRAPAAVAAEPTAVRAR